MKRFESTNILISREFKNVQHIYFNSPIEPLVSEKSRKAPYNNLVFEHSFLWLFTKWGEDISKNIVYYAHFKEVEDPFCGIIGFSTNSA